MESRSTFALAVLIVALIADTNCSPSPRQSAQRSAPSSAPTMLREDFEGAIFPPTGWTTQTIGLGLPHAWHRTTDPSYVGGARASAHVGSESPSRIDEWLISPGIRLAPPDDAIRFSWSGNQNWSHAVDASLNIREAGDSVWTQLWSIANNEPPADPFIYRERVVDLTSWAGLNVEFGFRVAGTNGASFGVDDVGVGDFDPTTAPPNDICSNATALDRIFSIEDVTCYAANDLSPDATPPDWCVEGSLNGPDVFYKFTVDSGDSLHAAVTAEWNPGIYFVDDCANPVCIVGATPWMGARIPSSITGFARLARTTSSSTERKGVAVPTD